MIRYRASLIIKTNLAIKNISIQWVNHKQESIIFNGTYPFLQMDSSLVIICSPHIQASNLQQKFHNDISEFKNNSY